MKFRAGAIAMGCLALLPAAHSSDEPVDPGLLEFLGSVDTEDKNWHEYLAHTDIDQVARRSTATRPNPTPAASSTPPASDPPKDPAARAPANNAPANSAPVNPK